MKTLTHATKGVKIVEVVKRDAKLKRMEALAQKAFTKHFPQSSSATLRLYKTREGQIGCEIGRMELKAGDQRRLLEAYADVMKIIGETRGRPRGTKKVQTKLNLSENVHQSLKSLARKSHQTLSDFVEELVLKANMSP